MEQNTNEKKDQIIILLEGMTYHQICDLLEKIGIECRDMVILPYNKSKRQDHVKGGLALGTRYQTPEGWTTVLKHTVTYDLIPKSDQDENNPGCRKKDICQ